MDKQITNSVFMIRPVSFHMNEETAVNNYYQKQSSRVNAATSQAKALNQFDNLVERLRAEGVDVIVIEDTPDPVTPDSIFPNNWISTHQDGSLRLYPMFAENRRNERREDIIALLKSDFQVGEIVSYADWERKSAFLEGTGSVILDRVNKIAYAGISDRTMPEVLDAFCEETGYQQVTFSAMQTVEGKRLPIYHTNVMMCVGEAFAVVCLDSIDNPEERALLVQHLKGTGKEIVEISEVQKANFAGNMLQIIGHNDQRLIVMSRAAWESLTEEQKNRLSVHGKLVYSDINMIEKLGGGSVRCMIAENFLPERKTHAGA